MGVVVLVLVYGGWAKVTEVKNRITQRVDVVYKLPKEACPCSDGERIRKMTKHVQKIEHANVCRLVEAFDDPEDVYLIYRQIHGKDLFSNIVKSENMTEQTVARIILQLARALSAGADLDPSVIHGALVPKNIFQDSSGAIILTDMGLIDLLKTDPVDNLKKGSMAFIAPEVL